MSTCPLDARVIACEDRFCRVSWSPKSLHSPSNIHTQICSLAPCPIACITVDCSLYGFSWFRRKKLACKGTNASRPVSGSEISKEGEEQEKGDKCCLLDHCSCIPVRVAWEFIGLERVVAATSWLVYASSDDIEGKGRFDKTPSLSAN